jgi:hypothetical protein
VRSSIHKSSLPTCGQAGEGFNGARIAEPGDPADHPSQFEINSLKVYSNSSSSTSSDAVSAASVRAPMGCSSVGLLMALTAVLVGLLALV